MKGFKTLKELEEKYPVGYCYLTCSKHLDFYTRTPQDLKVMKNAHPESKFEYIGDDAGFSIYRQYDVHRNYVEGYIFNGKEWFPAVHTWNGWDEIDIDEEEELCTE